MFLLLISNIDRTEKEDWQAIDYQRKLANELYFYKQKYGFLPLTLEELSIKNKLCPSRFKCFVFLYKVSEDKQDFKLSASVNYPFVVFFEPNWKTADSKGLHCCWNLGFSEDYKGSRKDLPIYLKDDFFVDPGAWPRLP